MVQAEHDTGAQTPLRGLDLPPQPSAVYAGFQQMPIAGVWRAGRSGHVAADRDPYTGATLVEIALANTADVDDAVHAWRLTSMTLAVALTLIGIAGFTDKKSRCSTCSPAASVFA